MEDSSIQSYFVRLDIVSAVCVILTRCPTSFCDILDISGDCGNSAFRAAFLISHNPYHSSHRIRRLVSWRCLRSKKSDMAYNHLFTDWMNRQLHASPPLDVCVPYNASNKRLTPGVFFGPVFQGSCIAFAYRRNEPRELGAENGVFSLRATRRRYG